MRIGNPNVVGFVREVEVRFASPDRAGNCVISSRGFFWCTVIPKGVKLRVNRNICAPLVGYGVECNTLKTGHRSDRESAVSGGGAMTLNKKIVPFVREIQPSEFPVSRARSNVIRQCRGALVVEDAKRFSLNRRAPTLWARGGRNAFELRFSAKLRSPRSEDFLYSSKAANSSFGCPRYRR